MSFPPRAVDPFEFGFRLEWRIASTIHPATYTGNGRIYQLVRLRVRRMVTTRRRYIPRVEGLTARIAPPDFGPLPVDLGHVDTTSAFP